MMVVSAADPINNSNSTDRVFSFRPLAARPSCAALTHRHSMLFIRQIPFSPIQSHLSFYSTSRTDTRRKGQGGGWVVA